MAPRSVNETDWQLECGEIKQRGARLLQTGQWSDCTFLVGPGPDQVHFKAHKLILAMASPVFEAMFYGSISEGNNPIPIPDMHPDTFRKFLDYIYTDNIELESFASARDLYYGAQKYMLPHLMKVCTTYLSCNLTPQTVGCTYEFAELVGDNELKAESLQMIRSETKAVLVDSNFEEMEIDTVIELFKMDPLNIDSELDLFAAAERYAKALDKRSEDGQEGATANGIYDDQKSLLETKEIAFEGINHPATSVEVASSISVPVQPVESNVQQVSDNSEMDVDKDNEGCDKGLQASGSEEPAQTEDEIKKLDGKRATIRNLIHQIRFLTLPARQFAEYKTLSSLLTESEILALLMNIVSSETHMPMPSGFSTCRVLRDRS